MDTFLNKIARELINNFGDSLTNVTVVLPNRRSKIFLINEIEQNIFKTIFSPSICSIQELTERISGIRSLDAVELLFELYKVYSEVSDKSEKQSFEQFAPWAKILLTDFSEIDSYLLEPDKVLQYLKEIKDIEHWSLSDKKTPIIEKHLKFWSLLPKLYESFYKHLHHKKIGYQGLIYRESVKNINEFSKLNKQEFFVFVGFNALMPSEEQIIKYLLKENQAKIYWDIDRVFLQDLDNQTGYFIRKIKNNWNYYNSNPFEWVFDEFSQQKNIKIIGTAKSVGQAKVVGKIIEQIIQKDSESLNKTALVLSEKSLMIPVLYALPANVDSLNITLEYSARNNPIQFLINRLFKMHSYAKSRKGEAYTFYYKDVLEVLSNPFVEPFVNSNEIVEIIKTNNFTFLTNQKLYELTSSQNQFFKSIFDKWEDNALSVLDRISQILIQIKSNLKTDSDSDRVTLAFVFELHKIINQLKNYFLLAPDVANLQNLYSIYKQVIDSAEVSFEGEPLSGLQIMGILESRTLDFENVIFTSVNEGKIPFGKTQNSFIPYDLKREFNLPTYKDRDAIYTYHFYRLLSRAKNIYLVYNTEDEGLDGGEKSRFITQLKIEKHPNHTITEEIYSANLPNVAYQNLKIEKSDLVMQRLKEIAEKGFSPSSLAAYVRNPIDFYYQRILKINENKEVEETIEANTLGTVIHNTLEELYKPHINKLLTVLDVERMENQYVEVIKSKFKEQFKEGDISKGKNLLALESAKRSVLIFLRMEKENLSKGDEVILLALEHQFERFIEDNRLPYPVKISGFIDRIEKRNGIIRIVDYKTGKVEANDLVLSDWSDFLGNEKKNKIIQLLSYVFIYEEKTNGVPVETGVISFKNLKNGFMSFGFKEGKERQQTITAEIIENFQEETVRLLLEILDENQPFEEKSQNV